MRVCRLWLQWMYVVLTWFFAICISHSFNNFILFLYTEKRRRKKIHLLVFARERKRKTSNIWPKCEVSQQTQKMHAMLKVVGLKIVSLVSDPFTLLSLCYIDFHAWMYACMHAEDYAYWLLQKLQEIRKFIHFPCCV